MGCMTSADDDITVEWDGPQPEPVQAEWFRKFGREVQEHYDRLHGAEPSGIQQAGHGAESTWVSLLKSWLPPAYDVLKRKYIVPEVGTEIFETDIVVINPSYPVPLREREEILPGGVAAAFSVKLTLDPAGIREGVEQAAKLRRALHPRIGASRHEMVGPFPVGLLAHSHTWTRPGSEPADNVTENLLRLDQEIAVHPRESLDYLCVSDLGMWSTAYMPYMPPSAMVSSYGPSAQQKAEGAAFTTIQQTDPNQSMNAIASLITHLLTRLSYYDSTLRPLADNLTVTGTLGSSKGNMRMWELSQVFTQTTRKELPSRTGREPNSDWAAFIF